jgi:hypothetical protein
MSITCQICERPITPPADHDPKAVFLCGACAGSMVLREAFLEGRVRLREPEPEPMLTAFVL